jgi:phenylalanyl-tRNA synthetase alpha chain
VGLFAPPPLRLIREETMKDRLEKMLETARSALAQAASEPALQEARVRFLGKKGELTAIMKGMGQLSPEERPVVGAVANKVKEQLEQLVETRLEEVREAEIARRLADERIDVTLPGRRAFAGTQHPITQVIAEIVDIFSALGFSVEEGPEVEKDFYNFEALNIPKDHPARDMQDTFYVSDEVVLRTHTSPVQIRTMLRQAPPVRVIAPGTI